VEYVLLLELLSTVPLIFLLLIQDLIYVIYMGVLGVFLLVIQMVQLTTAVAVLIGVVTICTFPHKRHYALILTPTGCQMSFQGLYGLKERALPYIPSLMMT